MAEEESGGDKQYDPTQKKLDDARRKGEIARSQDFVTALSYGGFLIAAWVFGSELLLSLGEAGANLLSSPDRFADLLFDDAASATAGTLIARVLSDLAPLMLIPAGCVVLGLVAQRGLVFTPSKLAPKLQRLSVIGNAKQKFGRSGLFEFAKSFAKLLIVAAILGLFLQARFGEIMISMTQSGGQVGALLGRLTLEFLALILILALVIGGIDLMWQVAELRRRNRMSHKDLTDEMKESEGDPHMKSERRRKAQALLSAPLSQRVAESSVVIVNPTHFAVALAWDPDVGDAPLCQAKGIDAVAARIRELAETEGIPIYSDPPTARALFATLSVGDEVRPEHYRPVAVAIRFAEEMRLRAKRRFL